MLRMAQPAVARISHFAEDQWGFVTRRQAESTGVSPATIQRLVDSGVLERAAHGVYRLSGAPAPDHAALRAAWLQLAPDRPAWERGADDGVISHRSAASLYGLGELPADRHEFTLPKRRTTRDPSLRFHQRRLADREWVSLRGIPVTRPSRIASDLLWDREDPGAVAHVIADALRGVFDYPGTLADSLAPHAARFGLPAGDGVALLRLLLEPLGDPQTPMWLTEARASAARSHGHGGGDPQ